MPDLYRADHLLRRAAATIRDELADLERQRILAALGQTGGNQRQAAELLGMPRRTLVRRLREYNLRPDRKPR